MDLDHTPLTPPKAPQVSNFVNPETLAPVIVAVSTVCLTLMLPIAALRFYVKAWVVRSIWWDDGK